LAIYFSLLWTIFRDFGPGKLVLREINLVI
jgi:hypothetical protein